MFLDLSHTKLDVFHASRDLALECYKLTKQFPVEEKFALVQQIRRAAMSVHLNIAEGSSRKSINERKRFYETSRGSVIELDAAFDVARELNYCNKESMEILGTHLIKTFKILCGMMK